MYAEASANKRSSNKQPPLAKGERGTHWQRILPYFRAKARPSWGRPEANKTTPSHGNWGRGRGLRKGLPKRKPLGLSSPGLWPPHHHWERLLIGMEGGLQGLLLLGEGLTENQILSALCHLARAPLNTDSMYMLGGAG